ncbi:Transcription factor SMP1 [Penicillium chrysogenum]|uniref:Transcription factor SMP1 n=1 Tax=Penicillium chrysogenum TaxID=5076 RepID=A0ABQ8WFR7_PENCH|nr:Transcription factor SMP1 [Penicillium chrysogenum]KAJ5265003.1 Transcription factor SMP1 [Penicillium chrysogenum]
MINVITMGRVKRAIIEVEDERSRRITCKKRSAGAMKKLHELAILCNQDIFLYIRDQETGKIRTFASCDEKFIPDYAAISQEDCKGPKDMEIYYNQQHRQKQPASQTRTEQQQSTQPKAKGEPDGAEQSSEPETSTSIQPPHLSKSDLPEDIER